MAYLLIAIAIIFRFINHFTSFGIPNFAPVAAIALFGGVYLKKRWALILPLAALVISDYFIGYYSWPVMASVYGSFALIGIIGLLVRKNKTVLTVFGGALGGSILFYIVTNFAVWAATPMYAKTLAGLGQCYVMAIPFFRSTLFGDIFFTGVLFGSYEIALAYQRKRVTQEA